MLESDFRYIHSSNRQGLSFTMAVNHLADRSDLELKALRGKRYTPGYNGGQAFPYNIESLTQLSATLPDNFDWRIMGAVTPVKGYNLFFLS